MKLSERLKNLFTPYKQFVRDGYSYVLPLVWCIQHRHLSEKHLLEEAKRQKLLRKVVG